MGAKPAALIVLLFVVSAGCTAPTASIPPPAAPPVPPPTHGNLTAAFVNVGQGDGTVWTLPDGSIIVYDCGPPVANASANPLIAHLTSIGRPPGSTLWALVASHGHLDHIGGCEEVLASYEVRHIYEVWYPGADAPPSYARWRDNIFHANATVHTLFETPSLQGEQLFARGDDVALTEEARGDGLRVRIEWPPSSGISSWNDIGTSSIVLRWSFGTVDFCTDGDIERDQEAALAALQDDLNCEVYLVGHHGSGDSSSDGWLAKMRPAVAVVSVGTNTFGHPAAEALCRVQRAGAHVFATERLGTVTVKANGTSFSVTPDRPETSDYCLPGANYWPAPPAPPAPPPTPPPAPPPSGLAVTATASPPDPCQFTTVVVDVHVSRGGSGVKDAQVTSTWHYKTSSPTESGTTDTGGDLQLSRYISGASAGYSVAVEVAADEGGESASANATFTPQAC